MTDENPRRAALLSVLEFADPDETVPMPMIERFADAILQFVDTAGWTQAVES